MNPSQKKLHMQYFMHYLCISLGAFSFHHKMEKTS